MVVVAMMGVMAAIALPNIVSGVRRADGERATLQVAGGIVAARDAARSRGACVDFVQEPAAPAPGPYLLRTAQVPCPGRLGDSRLISEVRLPPILSRLAMRPVQGSTPTGTVHFDPDGAVSNPFDVVEIITSVDGVNRTVTVFPVAGVVTSTSGQAP